VVVAAAAAAVAAIPREAQAHMVVDTEVVEVTGVAETMDDECPHHNFPASGTIWQI